MGGDVFPKVNVAAVQASPILNDREATVEKAIGLIEEAGRKGAELIVFPETWLPGYPFWCWEGRRWGNWARDRENPLRDRFAQLYRNAVDIPGAATEAIGKAARSAGAFVVMGSHERDTEFGRGTLYNTIIFFGPDGSILGKHRKLMPTGGERLVWGRGDGSTLPVFETELGRLGGLICWEHWMPAARAAMHALGEQIHVTQWPSVGEMHQVCARHYAFEGRTFVISVGSYLTTDQLPLDFPFRDDYTSQIGEAAVLHNGGTAIIGPDGMYIAGPVFDREEILYAELDLGMIPGQLQSFDASGHYARPDVFQVSVSTRKLSPVLWEAAMPDGPGTDGGDGLAQPLSDGFAIRARDAAEATA
jgi:nitrilase